MCNSFFKGEARPVFVSLIVVVLVLVPAKADKTYFIPHIATQWANFLLVDNLADTQGQFRLVLFDAEGSQVVSQTIQVPANGFSKWNVLDFHSSATSGSVTADDDRLRFRVAYVHPEENGVAEFPLPSRARTLQQFDFGVYSPAEVPLTWKGLALMNTADSSAEVDLWALDASGQVLASGVVAVPARQRIRGVLGDFFGPLEHESVARVTARSTKPVCGLNISGVGGSQLLFSLARPGGETPVVVPIPLGNSLRNEMDRAFASLQGKGVSVAVVLPNKATWVGTAQAAGADVIGEDTLFLVGSISKMITAAMTLQLVEEGILDFDSTISGYLPDFTHVDGSITVYQLLYHTSGIYDFPNHPEYNAMMRENPYRIWSPEEILSKLLLEPYFGPGEGWRYSTANYVVLGMLVERATGNKVSQELRKRIFDQYSMTHTFLDAQESVSGDIANLWWDADDDEIVEELEVDASRYPETSAAFTGGGMISSAKDVAQFTHALLRGDILTQEMQQEMLNFYLDLPPDFWWPGYGLGVSLVPPYIVHGALAYGHGGSIFFRSVTIYLPEYDVSIAVLVNSADENLMWQMIVDLSRVIMDFYSQPT